MDFENILVKRRSIRKFSPGEVNNETLEKLVRDSTCAPSSGNEQPWKFIVVNSREIMKEISDESKASLLERISANPDDYAKKYEEMLKRESFNIFYNAPALVIIAGKKSLKNTVINCTLAAGYFMMSAVNNGLGTCWVNFATALKSRKLLDKLGITEDDIIVAPIALGYPEIIPEMPKRKELDIKFIE